MYVQYSAGISDTLVLNMSTLVWSVVTTVQGRVPIASEVCFCSLRILILTALFGFEMQCDLEFKKNLVGMGFFPLLDSVLLYYCYHLLILLFGTVDQ